MTYLKIIPYLLLAIAIGAALWFRGNAIDEKARADRATADATTAVDANKKQASTIEELHDLDARKNALFAEITRQLATINQNVIDTNKAVSDLEVTDADVRKYLETIPPSELLRLLNRKGN
ncbi:hypothetical protein LJR231_001555 [Phyllobacterium sp. LjRoot231]|uniref:hypothetical protein n=1 Tax=Phyllobacterium sp. LjRoot231 TaxID=3342289 RepID=UPI003ECE0EC9